jgi:XTP/dITP diphosphohydrolase
VSDTVVVLATTNPHKLDEIRAILADAPFQLLSLGEAGVYEEPPETDATFLANALQKATFGHERTGLLCLADDSGLEVDALAGRPGVHSRRFTPEATAEANNRALLAALDGVTDRRARFRCAVAAVGAHATFTTEGTVEGVIATVPRGDHGFGYDPLFLPDDTPGRTMAELTSAEKHAISHRGRAFRALAQSLVATRGA